MQINELQVGQIYFAIGLTMSGKKVVVPCTLNEILKKPKGGYNVVITTSGGVEMYDLAADLFATKTECKMAIKSGK